MPVRSVQRLAVWAALVVAGAPTAGLAHEIPANVVVRGFVKPEGRVIRFLVRVPLEALRDYDFPLRGPGYLDLGAVGPLLAPAAKQWVGDYVRFREGDREVGPPVIVATRIAVPSDPSFGGYDQAVAGFRGPVLDAATQLPWRQALLDVWFEYPIESDRSRFAIEPALGDLGQKTITVLRFLAPDAAERAFEYRGNPGWVRLDPRWHQAAGAFLRQGFGHILDGLDHLLFLLCLVVPFRRFWSLVPVVTAFTVAHSITLVASVLGFAPGALWFPPLIEMLIAASIVIMTIENVVGARLDRRWIVAFGFGLVHGFGFSFALRDTLQFAGANLVTALVAFNVGVELGQVVVLLVMIPLLDFLFRRVMPERAGIIILSLFIGHTAWHWTTERGAALAGYQVAAPTIDAATAAAVLRWLALALVVGTAAWGLRIAFRRLNLQTDQGRP